MVVKLLKVDTFSTNLKASDKAFHFEVEKYLHTLQLPCNAYN